MKAIPRCLARRAGVVGCLVAVGWLAGGCAVMRPPTQEQFEAREAELRREGIDPEEPACGGSSWGFGIAQLLQSLVN